ncbi:MAG TPA: YciI family protein [Arenimonas sp.]|nr:YciI family protein [Arenimonas sp.]HOZ06329.1 YciI family protein [Arenimonas sp.]HPW31986.1 YciI family protein [Arenimonas sp.]
MWYLIIGTDVENSLENRMVARPAHLARLQALAESGRLKIAGPLPAIDSENPGQAGFTGSVIIASFENLQQAQAWALEDPYLEAGVYAKVEVRPFKLVLP